MKYLLDTCICVYLIKRQHPEILTKLLKTGFDKLCLSTITIAELEFGISNSNRQEESRVALFEFVLPFKILDFTYTAASFYGKIRKELKDKAKPISDMDMLIASIAMANDLILVSNNEKEFKRVTGLKLENWVKK